MKPKDRIEILRIAYAAGTDAGNRSMKRGKRRTWNSQDWNASVRTWKRVMKALNPKDPFLT